jgi:hypothetical protein
VANNCTATGYAHEHLPRGKKRDDILVAVRLGLKFKAQQCGKRPGVLSVLVLDCARQAGPPYTFAKLLDQLELAAARRELHGEVANPVEKIDRIWQLVTVHLPRRGRVQVPFASLRRHLTTAKINLRADIRG